jgi:hypothetical protein
VDEVQDVKGPTPPSVTTLRALSTEQRWGVSGTLITSNGLETLKVLSVFLTLRPFCDSRWWSDNVNLRKALVPSKASKARTQAASSAPPSTPSSTPSSLSIGAILLQGGSVGDVDPFEARLSLLKEFARLHVWRSRQQDVKSMPPQVYLDPVIVHASHAEFAVLYPKMGDFVAAVSVVVITPLCALLFRVFICSACSLFHVQPLEGSGGGGVKPGLARERPRPALERGP